MLSATTDIRVRFKDLPAKDLFIEPENNRNDRVSANSWGFVRVKTFGDGCDSSGAFFISLSGHLTFGFTPNDCGGSGTLFVSS